MTKLQLILKLREKGHWWPNESYPKAYLERFLKETKEASKMSLAELFTKIEERNKVKS